MVTGFSNTLCNGLVSKRDFRKSDSVPKWLEVLSSSVFACYKLKY